MNLTPNHISKLESGQVFVFGSNEKGMHGAGAAYLAHKRFGAKWGRGNGLSGQSYGIPTKDNRIKKLSKEKVQEYVDQFIRFAEKNPHLHFLVTKIGCGLAHFTVDQIAPMFAPAALLSNVSLPEEFHQVLQTK